MSAYPLPTEGCHCATCEYLRTHIDEHGNLKTQMFGNADRAYCLHLNQQCNTGGTYCTDCRERLGP